MAKIKTVKILASNSADELAAPAPLDPLELFSVGTGTRFRLRQWRLVIFWADAAQRWAAL
jgi:hypothetical protein